MPEEIKPPVAPVASAAPVVTPLVTQQAEQKAPEQAKNLAEPVKPYVFDEKAFEAKNNTLIASMKAVEGKPNYNPYHWANLVGLTDIIKRYKLGERSQGIASLMARLPSVVPCVDKDYVAPETYKPSLPKALQPPVKK